MKLQNFAFAVVITGLFAVSSGAQASTQSLEAIEAAHGFIGNGTWQGRENKSTTCSLTTNWVFDAQRQPVLQVTMKSKYHSNTLDAPERVWNVEYRAEQELSIEDTVDEAGLKTMSLASTETLSDEPNDEVYLYKILRLEVDASGKLTSATVNFAEVNQHSDPSEDSVICNF